MRIIDFHAHAFPDDVAERAIPHLESEGNVRAFLDGKVDSLLRSMDEASIDISVICSIATKPSQFSNIIEWSHKTASDRLIMLPSIHPADPHAVERIHQIAGEGFKGIKLHPYYQDFVLDEPRMFPIYEAAQKEGLLIVSHTGFDIAFPRIRRADPSRVQTITRRFPELLFVATHMGAWEDWESVTRHILGNPIYMETSFSLDYLGPQQTTNYIAYHPAEYLLFGTDSPWADQKQEVDKMMALEMPEEDRETLFFTNAARLLGLA